MHELSLAESILKIALDHRPPGTALRRVSVVAGPMRSIDRGAMEVAWSAVIQAGQAPLARLDLDLLPWTLLCPECGRQWTSPDLAERCVCGSMRPHPAGGNELQVKSISVDETEE